MEMQAKLKISADIESFLKRHKKIAPEAIEKGMHYISIEAPKNVQKKITSMGLTKSGDLKRGISGEVVKREKAVIGAKAFYAPILQAGAKPHKIKFDRKKALNWSGSAHPINEVSHPGFRKKRFLSGTIDDMSDSGALETLFSRGIREAMERFGLNG